MSTGCSKAATNAATNAGGTVCPTCLNRIEDKSVLRCPRCYTSLLKMGCDGNCRKCAAQK